MKTVTKAALSALLLTGVAGGAIVAQPALAQKKDKESKEKPLKLSPDVLKAAQAAQTAIQANDLAAAEPAVAQVEAGAKNDDDKYFAAQLRLQVESKKLQAAQAANPNAPLDETRLAAPLDALIASPRVAQADKAKYAFFRGQISLKSKQYPQALQYLQQAQQLGYQDPNLGLLLVQARQASGDTAGSLTALTAEIDRQVAAGQKPSEDLYRFAIAQSQKAKLRPQTLAWMDKFLRAYPTPKNWRDMLVFYGLQPGSMAQLDNPQKIDLFRLMRASKSLADQYDYGEYAQKTRDRGLPAESLAVLKEGMAAGKIPATNAEYKTMLTEVTRMANAEASLSSLEAKAKSAGDGKLAAQTAEAYLSQGNYAKAAELYRLGLQKGGVNADEVNMRLGIALANSGDKAGAKAAFAAVRGQPRAELAGFWNTYLDTSA